MPDNHPDGNMPEDPSAPENPGGPSTAPIVYDFILYSDTGYNIFGIRYVSGSCLVSDGDEWRFCNVGKVSGIEKITSIPWTGWDALTSVYKGTGVVAYHPSRGFMTLFIGQELYDEGGRVIGVYVIYRKDFTGLDAPVDLKTYTVNAPAEGVTVDIPVTAETYTPFQVMSVDESWCKAAAKTVDNMIMPSLVSVTVNPNHSSDTRETTVVVASVNGQGSTVKVIQAGSVTDEDDEQ